MLSVQLRRPRVLLLVGLTLGLTHLIAVPAHAVAPVTAAAQVNAPLPGPPGLDHYKCYAAEGVSSDPYEFPRGTAAVLTDQFGSRTFEIGRLPVRLCNPVNKILPTGQQFPPQNPRAHLVCFVVTEPGFTPREIQVQNQFGTARLTAFGPTKLCVPTWKNFTGQFPRAEQPPGRDHFLCYPVRYSTLVNDTFEAIPTTVRLRDQFGQSGHTVSDPPQEMCNPVEKRIGTHFVPITNPDAHLTCFGISPGAFTERRPFTKNQFGRAMVRTFAPPSLCLPSFKKEVPGRAPVRAPRPGLG